jgi:hypothetical protein
VGRFNKQVKEETVKQVTWVAIFCLAFCLLLVVSCQNDQAEDDDETDDDSSDDDSSDDDAVNGDDEPKPGCERNQPVELLGVTAILNGVPADMPFTVSTQDQLALSFEYADADCNLEGGHIHLGLNEGEKDNLDIELIMSMRKDYPLEDIGCSSEQSGPYLIPIDPTFWLLPDGLERDLPLTGYFDDVCDAGAQNPFYIDIEFVE